MALISSTCQSEGPWVVSSPPPLGSYIVLPAVSGTLAGFSLSPCQLSPPFSPPGSASVTTRVPLAVVVLPMPASLIREVPCWSGSFPHRFHSSGLVVGLVSHRLPPPLSLDFSQVVLQGLPPSLFGSGQVAPQTLSCLRPLSPFMTVLMVTVVAPVPGTSLALASAGSPCWDLLAGPVVAPVIPPYVPSSVTLGILTIIV